MTSSQFEDMRVQVCRGVERGAALTIYVDGQPIPAFEGETVASAMLAAGIRGLRSTFHRSENRGVFCGMGVCFDCLVTVDDRPSIRACLTWVADGMKVERQSGNGK